VRSAGTEKLHAHREHAHPCRCWSAIQVNHLLIELATKDESYLFERPILPIPLMLGKSVLPKQLVDFAERFAEDWNVIPRYRVFAEKVLERPLGQAVPFFIVN
jgi:hypothetical protein